MSETDVVRVHVYDAVGRRVSTLHEGVLPAGENVLSMNGSALPSSVYLIRMESDGGQSKSLVVHVVR